MRISVQSNNLTKQGTKIILFQGITNTRLYGLRPVEDDFCRKTLHLEEVAAAAEVVQKAALDHVHHTSLVHPRLDVNYRLTQLV